MRDEAEVDQDLAELVAALFLQFERAVQILLGDQLALDQDLAEPHALVLFRRDYCAVIAARRIAPCDPGAFFGACITIWAGNPVRVFPVKVEQR